MTTDISLFIKIKSDLLIKVAFFMSTTQGSKFKAQSSKFKIICRCHSKIATAVA